MKKTSFLFALVAVGCMALFVVMSCQTAVTPGPVLSALTLANSSGTALTSGATTASRVLTVSGTVDEVTITSFTLTVNTVSMSVPVTSGAFSQKITLNEGSNSISISFTNAAGGTTISNWTITASITGGAYGIWAQLTWDTTSDMDLHLNKSTGAIADGTDCYYSQKAPNWDGSGSNTPGADTIAYPANPVLDYDNTTSYGPENTVLQTPTNGQSYSVKVRAYGGSATPTVRIYKSGTLVKTYTCPRAITSTGGTGGAKEVWSVCTISWSGGAGTITDVNTIGTSSLSTKDTK